MEDGWNAQTYSPCTPLPCSTCPSRPRLTGHGCKPSDSQWENLILEGGRRERMEDGLNAPLLQVAVAGGCHSCQSSF